MVTIVDLGLQGSTGEDGAYRVTLTAAARPGVSLNVTVRAVGYRPATAVVDVPPESAGPARRDFTLASNPLRLGEIVVTGAQTHALVEQLGHARTAVDSTAVRRSGEANVAAALAATAANVEVTSSSGAPGASASIRVRGVNTLGTNGEPLFVIDGVPVDNSATTTAVLDPQQGGAQAGTSSPNRGIDLNPSDIESIEVLEGAAAGAIYGTRAGQGVILITTKRGRPGATHYSLHTSASLSGVSRFPALQRAFGQGTGRIADVCAAPSGQQDCTASFFSWGAPLGAETPTFDHAREIFRTSTQLDQTLSVSGGGDRTTFYLSGSRLGQDGTIVGPNNRLLRNAFRLKGDQRITDALTVGANVSYSATHVDAVQKGNSNSSPIWGAWLTPPEYDNRPARNPITGMHRSYAYPHPGVGSAGVTRYEDNPFFSAVEDVGRSDANRFIGAITALYALRSGLTFNGSLGIDQVGDSRLQGMAQTSSNSPNPLGQVIVLDMARQQLDETATATATYARSRTLAGSLTLGQSFNDRTSRELGDVGNALNDEKTYSLINTATQFPSHHERSHLRTAAVFGEHTLDLWDQFHLRTGLRYDAASTYATSSSANYGAFFPSVSVAWEFTKAAFRESRLLSTGKLRLAYGEVGTEPTAYLGYFAYRAGATYPDLLFGNAASQGGYGALITPTSAPAGSLRPERTTEVEGGLDVGLVDDRVDASVTAYHRVSRGVILPVPVPGSSGFTTQFGNGATIRNVGASLTLNARLIATDAAEWDLGITAGLNRNRVLALRDAQFLTYGGLAGSIFNSQAVAQVGYPVGSFRDFDYVRCGNGVTLTRNGAAYAVDANCSAAEQGSRALFISDGSLVNADGSAGLGAGYPLLDPTPRIIGSPDPQWTGAISTHARIGQLSLSALLQLRRGGLVYNATRGALNYFGTSAESARRGEMVTFGDSYFPGPVVGPGAGKAVPLTQDWFQRYDSYVSTIGAPFYEDGSFARLREISVSYLFNGPGIRRVLGLSSAALRLAGHNLFLRTGYTGADPETSLGGSETGARGFDFFTPPQTCSITLSLDLAQ